MHKKALSRSAESKIRATLKLAESDVRLSVEPARLDADPELLNTPSGVVDLREGKLYQHDPDLLMTKLAGAVYDPNACSERWLCFLEEATGGDDELAAWLQRFAGYAATGHATEEVVAFLYGPGATGKTTWCEAVRAARGSYAATAEFASFLAGRSDGSAASPDIARLVGVRAAFASEVNPGQRFNPQRLKSLTGGETITARRLYRDPIEFRPEFSLVLAANERPAIPADDSAAWRRIRLVPFDNVVPPDARSPTLKDKLVNDHDERAGVLAWIVQGAIDWYRDGLGTCRAIDGATASYPADQRALAPPTWTAKGPG
jgi:putative DNA primase/helicase